MLQFLPLLRRFAAPATLLALGVAVTGCGGGDDASTDSTATAAAEERSMEAEAWTRPPPPPPVPTGATVSTKVRLPGFPHEIDILKPVGATRIIVFLHGSNSKNYSLEYTLGLNKHASPPEPSNINWDWLTKNKIIAVFPQGQALPSSPTTTTWSNLRADSGQDDVAFLKALSSYLKSTYLLNNVAIAGHSAGGMMTGRMWCEATTSYNAYVSLSSPAPIQYLQDRPCSPSAVAPYMVMIGGQDKAIGAITAFYGTPSPQELAAGLTNSAMASELTQHHNRAAFTCGENPDLSTRTSDSTGSSWTNCSGRTIYRVVTQGDHDVASMDLYAGIKMIDAITQFSAPR